MPNTRNARQIKMRMLPSDDDGDATAGWNRAMELSGVSPDCQLDGARQRAS